MPMRHLQCPKVKEAEEVVVALLEPEALAVDEDEVEDVAVPEEVAVIEAEGVYDPVFEEPPEEVLDAVPDGDPEEVGVGVGDADAESDAELL